MAIEVGQERFAVGAFGRGGEAEQVVRDQSAVGTGWGVVALVDHAVLKVFGAEARE